LDRGDGGVFGGRDVDELTRATRGALRDVQVIADEMEERLIPDELAAAKNGVTVARGGFLGDEPHAWTERPAGFGVRRFVAGADDHAKFLDAGAGGLLEHDLERGLRFALLVDEGLQRERALAGVGSGDERFANGHGGEKVESLPGVEVSSNLKHRRSD
jgi:hypothetical protein